ncbi:hypothetical protein PMI15_02542 [Polaromonas sp. CF318]|uniref:hypothetical protein n=1 Tax=Polaromonas sp. CF318 TaxID=1144318 RepID=UPI000270F9AA|nr:hypothetical protein [Polaromonas sp. CF318]EJL83745.1 hypothetical protein PMI15_02542 [Polaromonas sp. CF318]
MEKLPEKATGDTVHAIVKSIASAVPTAGGPLSVLLETLFAPPIERRREKWFKQLAEVVSQLEQRVEGLSAENLSQNELFITIAIQATTIALRNHQDEKISALRGAILHAGLPDGPDEQLQLMFLQFVDELTPLHIAMLAILNGPVRWMEQHQMQYPGWGMGSVSAVVEHCLPVVRGRREVYEQIVRDLQARGLIHQGQFLNVNMTGNGMVESRTTEIGKAFIAYVSEEA